MDVISPLLPFTAPINQQIDLFSALGMVTDLCINCDAYCELTIEAFMSRVMNALQSGQAHIVFDSENRPLGFASWVFACETLHAQLTQNPSIAVIHHVADIYKPNAEQENQHLWFVDLITPFSSDLPLVSSLKERLSEFPAAWALSLPMSEPASTPRRIW